MKRKLTAILMIFVMILLLTACGAGKETTLTGMVVELDGTVISLMEMDAENLGSGMDFAGGERPEMPESMDGFQGFGDFDPEDFQGMFPGGGSFPQWGSGEMPEMPEGMEPPEGMTMPNFSGGDMDFDFEGFGSDAQTKDVDIGDAHISVEINGGKASGTLSDIEPGTFVTITMNGKGEVTNVLVSSRSGFGG